MVDTKCRPRNEENVYTYGTHKCKALLLYNIESQKVPYERYHCDAGSPEGSAPLEGKADALAGKVDVHHAGHNGARLEWTEENRLSGY